MMISTKGRYALRVMLDLAQQPSDTYISLKAIAQRQDVSMKYLEAIIQLLNKAGLVQSLRGKGGGYRLSYPPEQISVGTIVHLTEGTLSPVPCLDSGTCQRQHACLTQPMWRELDQIIENYLGGVTLADLLAKADGCGGQAES